MSVLCHAEVDGDRLSDEDLRHESLLILIGGDETTRHVLSGGLYQLVVDPARRDAVVADRSLLPVAIEEMLRWVSPIKNMCRTVVADTELRGQMLLAGQKLMLFYPSANRDEEVFADPFTFDIRRQPNEHVAFGFGTHFCLGASLARLELSVMFDCLLERLPDIALAVARGARVPGRQLRERLRGAPGGLHPDPVPRHPRRLSAPPSPNCVADTGVVGSARNSRRGV